MPKKLSSKQKKYEEEMDEEEDGENEYIEDDFLVNDEEYEGDRPSRPVLGLENPDAPDAVLEEELEDSDLEVLDKSNKQKSRLRKKKDKERYSLEEDDKDLGMLVDEERREPRRNYQDDEMDNFIVKRDRVARSLEERSEGRRPIRNTTAHGIFSLDNEDADEYDIPELAIREPEKQLNRIYTNEEIEEEYVTPKDNKIKSIDIPERHLLKFSEE